MALRWEGQRLEIERIEAEWFTPGGRRFRVRTRDGRIFDLSYSEPSDEWLINPV